MEFSKPMWKKNSIHSTWAYIFTKREKREIEREREREKFKLRL
jgi:hypothetical protein